MRMLGLDLGQKNVGVATSDALGLTSNPLTTITRRRGPAGDRALVAAVVALVRAEEAGAVVVGLPLNMDGSAGPSARAAQAFAKLLEAAAGVPVHLWDERMSTMAVERTLIEADLSRQRRREVIDRAAAAYILQGFLDHGRRFPSSDEATPQARKNDA